MREKKPVPYNLQFDTDVTFWPPGDASPRRTFIMPLHKPQEFVGFGVLGRSKEVLFAARGEVEAHLGKFIAQMQEAGSTVELYARPPLPAPIWKPYLDKGDDYEHMETEAPPPPPDGPGLRENDSEALLGLSSEAQLWPGAEERGGTRLVLYVSLQDSDEFLAFGLVQLLRDEAGFWRVPFVARGSMSADFGSFKDRMMNVEKANVEFCVKAPDGPLSNYVSAHFPEVG